MTRTLRRVAQIVILTGWVYIIWATKYPLAGFVNPRAFFQLDPLVMLLTAVAERVWLPGLWLTAITLLVTWLFGRVFCGWFCPLGAVMDLTAAATRRWRKDKEADPSRWQVLKYLILAGIAVLAFGGIQFVWFLDPLAIFVRFFSLNLHPFLNSGLDHALAWILTITGSPAWLEQGYEGFKDILLDASHPVFPHSAFILIFFLAILAAVFLQRRFWCRYLCPLGGLLGLIARQTPYRRVVRECTKNCGICRNACRTNAIQSDNGYRPQECVVCLDCTVVCPGQRTDFVFRLPPRKPSVEPEATDGLTRAQFLALAAGALASTAAASRPGAGSGRSPYLLRPPGALPETEFVQRCVRCGNCMKVCLTNVLQPALLESGLEGLWTPHLAPAVAYCEYQCNLCGPVCPTGAIRALPVEAKKHFRMGLATVNRSLCYPWAHGSQCLVCEEHCPVASKAIKVDYFINAKGKRIGRPVVDASLCIGCAICENKCPVKVEKAIRVRAL